MSELKDKNPNSVLRDSVNLPINPRFCRMINEWRSAYKSADFLMNMHETGVLDDEFYDFLLSQMQTYIQDLEKSLEREFQWHKMAAQQDVRGDLNV